MKHAVVIFVGYMLKRKEGIGNFSEQGLSLLVLFYSAFMPLTHH